MVYVISTIRSRVGLFRNRNDGGCSIPEECSYVYESSENESSDVTISSAQFFNTLPHTASAPEVVPILTGLKPLKPAGYLQTSSSLSQLDPLISLTSEGGGNHVCPHDSIKSSNPRRKDNLHLHPSLPVSGSLCFHGMLLIHTQQAMGLISASKTSHTHTQQQRPPSPAVTLTWHASNASYINCTRGTSSG